MSRSPELDLTWEPVDLKPLVLQPYSFRVYLNEPSIENRLQTLMLETGASEALDETHRKTRSRRLIRCRLVGLSFKTVSSFPVLGR